MHISYVVLGARPDAWTVQRQASSSSSYADLWLWLMAMRPSPPTPCHASNRHVPHSRSLPSFRPLSSPLPVARASAHSVVTAHRLPPSPSYRVVSRRTGCRVNKGELDATGRRGSGEDRGEEESQATIGPSVDSPPPPAARGATALHQEDYVTRVPKRKSH